ncbi:MAG: hypothetical protein F6K17_11815 [Okeania sp. SIO3C4]|nr:hypothetical protein [Okeania sp. SIO3B3]NER03258.1 hypothetical protein [Okeania sp. SIO3C4]
MTNINLPAGNLTLKLISKEPKNPRWISVFIQTDKEMIELGAEGDSDIVERFSSFLNLDIPLHEERTHIKNGVVYTTILLLSELHTAIYGIRKSGNVEIYFQNGMNLQSIATINLSQEECNVWIQKLNDLLN